MIKRKRFRKYHFTGEKVVMQESLITFEEVSSLYLTRKIKRNKIKHNTERYYRNHLIRLNQRFGSEPICNITNENIEQFFDDLTEADSWVSTGAISKKCLSTCLKKKGVTQAQLATLSGLSLRTVETALQGNKISRKSASKIADALEKSLENLFSNIQVPQRLSQKSILGHFQTCSTIFRFAYKMGYIESNPMIRTESPSSAQVEVNYYQPLVEKNILKATEKEDMKWRVYIHLLCITGCRRGEIAALTWQNINLNQGVIKISQNLLYSPQKYLYLETPKNRKVRFLNLPEQTIALLKQYKRQYQKKRASYMQRRKALAKTNQVEFAQIISGMDFLFLSEKTGLPMYPDSLNKWLKRFQERNGLQHLNPHAFRHTMASILIFKGVDIVSVSKRLGHARPTTTENLYGQLIAEAEAINSYCIAEALLT